MLMQSDVGWAGERHPATPQTIVHRSRGAIVAGHLRSYVRLTLYHEREFV